MFVLLRNNDDYNNGKGFDRRTELCASPYLLSTRGDRLLVCFGSFVLLRSVTLSSSRSYTVGREWRTPLFSLRRHGQKQNKKKTKKKI